MLTSRLLPVYRIEDDCVSRLEDEVATEFALRVRVNGELVATLACSPSALDCLAAGFLRSAGIIESRQEINSLTVAEDTAHITLRQKEGLPAVTNPPAPGPGEHAPACRVSPPELHRLMKELLRSSRLFRATGSAHCAAACSAGSFVSVHEDIGRHNTLDKVFGDCLLRNIPLHDKLVATTGRLARDMVTKLARCGVPLAISKAPPTDAAVELAWQAGLTLVGFVREGRMTVYTHPERVCGRFP